MLPTVLFPGGYKADRAVRKLFPGVNRGNFTREQRIAYVHFSCSPPPLDLLCVLICNVLPCWRLIVRCFSEQKLRYELATAYPMEYLMIDYPVQIRQPNPEDIIKVP
jgi:hypothetical protein